MIEVILFICVVVSFLLAMVIGNYLYKLQRKRKFNYFNNFPFEMENKKDPKLTLLFRILLIAFIGFCCVDILFLLFFPLESDIFSKFLGGILLLEAYMLLGLFLISSVIYKGHIFLSCSFFVLNFMSYVGLGYKVLLDEKPLAISIICFIIGFILLIVMFSPVLREWYKLNKKVTKQEIVITRKRFNLYVFNEWVNILFFILNIFLCLIINIL